VRSVPSPLPDTLADAPSAPPCPTCGGVGWLIADAPYGHPDFARLVPCACVQAQRAERQTAELLRASNLDAFPRYTFDRFEATVPGMMTAYRAALEFARSPNGWLTLVGSYGCGKTHLAAAIANQLLAQQAPVLFVVMPDLLDHLRRTFAPDSPVSYDRAFSAVRKAPVLILDDLGTESSTAWAQEKLYQLVNHRYNYRLPTVFTSNVPLDRLDGRIASRVHDAGLPAQIVTITAPDYRRASQERKVGMPCSYG
jgi:DNA replication protein DnaC